MKFKWLLLLPLLFLCETHAERCDVHLLPFLERDVFMTFLSRQSPRLDMSATPLEISASLRSWKAELARALGRRDDELELRLESEFAFTPGYMTLLLVESVRGLKPVIAAEYDPRQQLLKYIDPIYNQKLQWSTFYRLGSGPYRLVGFEDILGRVHKAGNVRAILALKILGL